MDLSEDLSTAADLAVVVVIVLAIWQARRTGARGFYWLAVATVLRPLVACAVRLMAPLFQTLGAGGLGDPWLLSLCEIVDSWGFLTLLQAAAIAAAIISLGNTIRPPRLSPQQTTS